MFMTRTVLEPKGVDLWTDEFLQTMRTVGDPFVDTMIADLAESGGRAAVEQLVLNLRRWVTPLGPSVPQNIREFLEEPVEMPPFMDPLQIALGQQVFRDHGPLILAVLGLDSLPRFFTNEVFSQALTLAQVLNPATLKNRFMEVAFFIMLFAMPEGLDLNPPKGTATSALQRLRVIHGATRYFLEPKWRSSMAKPISQSEIAQAKLFLSLWTINGLRKFNLELTYSEQEAILVSWNLAGFLLGLDTRLIPKNLAEAQVLNDRLTRLQSTSNSYGIALAAQLLQIIEGFLPWFLRRIPAGLMRYLMGNKIADMVQIPHRNLWVTKILVKLLSGFVMGDAGRHEMRDMADLMASHEMMWLLHEDRQAERGRFEMPAELHEAWDMTEREAVVKTLAL